MKAPTARGVRFERFVSADAAALAALLRDPEITRNITANASTAERALVCAGKRIAWHNDAWEAHGYGVWALRSDDAALAAPGELVGWCGFAEPDVQPGDPEILYGLARGCWGRGLGTRVARAAIDWLFEHTDYAGVSAIISARLNPGTLGVVRKLGMRNRGTMAFTEFLPDPALAAEVLAYEQWRLREAHTDDITTLIEQTCYRAGQLTTACVDDVRDDLLEQLVTAARARASAAPNADRLAARVNALVAEGQAHPRMDWYHVSRSDWVSRCA